MNKITHRQRRWRWALFWIAFTLAGAVFLAIAGLRTSLPQLDGRIALPGLAAPVEILRDARGYPTIRAANDGDAYRALGFVHAQDRLFQMEMMRRIGAGRLAEIVGEAGIRNDRLMRLLGLADQAEAQFAAASPELKAALEAYAEGVNAYLARHRGALPPEFLILRHEPEPWRPVDSLIWGRLMALQLSGNWREEKELAALKAKLPPWLFALLAPQVESLAWPGGMPFGPSRDASNNWAIGPQRSRSGFPLLANDPHLALDLPATWYLARIETPQRALFGATAPGLPFIVIGSNRAIAWGFTTTHSDTQDLFEEKPVPGDPGFYATPVGKLAFVTKRILIKVRGGEDRAIDLRWSRHGPIVSDLDPDAGKILALAWSGFLPDDRSAEALLAMNRAIDAGEFRRALRDFHTPQQNVVFVDREGSIGFVAAGRVPLRRALFADSRLPAPGWSGDYDWTGTLPFDDLPAYDGGALGLIVTANQDIRPPDYAPFLTAVWPSGERAQRIAELLTPSASLDLADAARPQTDILSQPLRDLMRGWAPFAEASDPELAALLAAWDGEMRMDAAAPLIATLWLDRAARGLLADEPGLDFEDWWFWQIDAVQAVLADGRACDDRRTPETEDCATILTRTLQKTRGDLAAAFGPDIDDWQWGKAHRAPFAHPIFGRLPIIADWLDRSLATPGDGFTIDRGQAIPPGEGVALRHVHGAGMRFVIDLADPDSAWFALAGGQSGNPFSPHYADGLADWRDGRYRSMLAPAIHRLLLIPEREIP